MPTIFVSIHLPNKPKEILPLSNIDFDKNIEYLKELIAKELKYNAEDLELYYNFRPLGNDLRQLSSLIKPNGIVHCFRKTMKNSPNVPLGSVDRKRIQELLAQTPNGRVSLSGRMNILSKVLTKYPELRRDLGAQALIRDSVIFYKLHTPYVLGKLAIHHPLMCKAAPLILSLIREELTLSNSATDVSEQETSSSEEDISSSAIDGSNLRNVTRQQIADVLVQVGLSSSNSLSLYRSSYRPITSGQLDQLIAHIYETLSSGDEIMDTSESTTPAVADASLEIDPNDILPANYRQHHYAEQLRSMAEMGFTNYSYNIKFLMLANGNVVDAINIFDKIAEAVELIRDL